MLCVYFFFFFKQKTAYEMRISDWSSDVCSSDLRMLDKQGLSERDICTKFITPAVKKAGWDEMTQIREEVSFTKGRIIVRGKLVSRGQGKRADYIRSEEHTSELQSLMRISYAVFCLKKKKTNNMTTHVINTNTKR